MSDEGLISWCLNRAGGTGVDGSGISAALGGVWRGCSCMGGDEGGVFVEVYALPPLLYYFSSFLLFYPCSILLFRFYTFISCAMQHLLLLFHSQHLHKLLFCLVRIFTSFLACFPRY